MIRYSRYPHIKDLMEYYISALNRSDIESILLNGIKNENDAENLSKFIWQLLDQMSKDSNNEIETLGRTDNSDMIPDLEYEITLYIDEYGYINVWDRVSDEESLD